MILEYDITLEQARANTDPKDLVARTRRDGYTSYWDASRPVWFKISQVVADQQTAQEIAAAFPKLVKLKGTGLRGSPQGTGYLSLDINMAPGKVNQGANETGLKRIRALFRAADKLGIRLVRVEQWGNSSPYGAADYGWL